MLTKYSLIVTGTLKGYDQLMNLVLDNVEEVTRGMPSSFPIPSETIDN